MRRNISKSICKLKFDKNIGKETTSRFKYNFQDFAFILTDQNDFPIRTSGCDKRPTYDETKFEQHIGMGHWLEMPCAPGTAFNPVDCQCSLTLMTIPGKVRQGTADSFSLNIYIFVRYTCNILYGSHKMKANEKSEIINNDVSCPVK